MDISISIFSLCSNLLSPATLAYRGVIKARDRRIMYLYIAQYVHKLGSSLQGVTEKKIGITCDLKALQHEEQGPIVCSLMAAWMVGDKCGDVKSALNHILADDRIDSTPDWFEDRNETLCDRLMGFMKSLGYSSVVLDGPSPVSTHVSIGSGDAESNESVSDFDLVDPVPNGNSHIRERPSERKRVDLLIGEEFSCTHKGVTNTVRVEAPGIFYSVTERRKFNTGRQAINSLYVNSLNDKLTGASINWWTKPKNKDGLTPDDVITKKLKLSTPEAV